MRTTPLYCRCILSFTYLAFAFNYKCDCNADYRSDKYYQADKLTRREAFDKFASIVVSEKFDDKSEYRISCRVDKSAKDVLLFYG